MRRNHQHPRTGSHIQTKADTPRGYTRGHAQAKRGADPLHPHRLRAAAAPVTAIDEPIDPTPDWNGLPEQPTRLIGQETLVDATVALLEQPEIRMVTLVGFGGVGKTHLATEVARRAAPGYDLIRFVDLAPLDADGVPGAIAEALGAESQAGETSLTHLSGHLRGRRALLLLDNFEHVLDAAAHVATLLAAVRELDILVTSREPLHVRWEHVTRVTPLDTPDNCSEASPEDLARYPAVALFIAMVQRLRPNFTLNAENAARVCELCRRLDGLPLALELAATMLQTSTLDQLHERLDTGLESLRANLRDLPARQLSMRASLDWSYERLTPDEQLAARQAAMFAGGGSPQAARAVIALEDGAATVDETLIALAEKSLIDFDPSQGSAARFSLLGIAREYLLDKLTLGEREALMGRFASYYTGFAESFARAIGGDTAGGALQALHQEHKNFRAILWTTLIEGNTAAFLRLAAALNEYWYRSGRLTEAAGWYEQLLAGEGAPEQPDQRIGALRWAGSFAFFQGHLDMAARRLEEARALPAATNGTGEHIEACVYLARTRLAAGDIDAMEAVLGDIAAMVRANPEPAYLSEMHCVRAAALAARGEVEQARALLLDIKQAPDNSELVELVTRATLMLADVELIEGAAGAARGWYNETVVRARDAGDWYLETRGHIGLGIIASQAADERAALDHLTEAFEIAAGHSDEAGVALALDALATLGLSGALIQLEWLPFAGLAEAMFERLGMSAGSPQRKRTASHHRMVVDVLGEEEAARLMAEGRELSLGHARARLEEVNPEQAVRLVETRARDESLMSELERLTRREREVVRLIARGMTNRQIALKLAIAERTVDTHVTNIFRKLGVSSRVSVAAWAVERGLANR